MTPAWLIWPFIVLLALSLQAIWRVLRLWYVPVVGAVAAFVGMFIALIVMSLQGPYKDNDPQMSVYDLALLLRWWHRWRRFEVARLLSDDWTHQPILLGSYPTDRQVREGVFHVCSAATLTVGSLVLLLLFTYALVTSFTRTVQPFAEGAHR